MKYAATLQQNAVFWGYKRKDRGQSSLKEKFQWDVLLEAFVNTSPFYFPLFIWSLNNFTTLERWSPISLDHFHNHIITIKPKVLNTSVASLLSLLRPLPCFQREQLRDVSLCIVCVLCRSTSCMHYPLWWIDWSSFLVQARWQCLFKKHSIFIFILSQFLPCLAGIS